MDLGHSGPVRLDDDVAYQDQSIVSRVLLRNPLARLPCSPLMRGQSLSEHTAPFDALVLVLEGEAEVFIRDECHRLGPLQALLLPANVPYAVNAPSRFKMLLTMIRSVSPP